MENEEQLKVVKKLKEVLHILTHVKIKNEESLGYISKPLDDLLTSLKYLPADPPFISLPTEIKTDILGYLCNSGTFLASSVCQEWKEILKPQVDKGHSMSDYQAPYLMSKNHPNFCTKLQVLGNYYQKKNEIFFRGGVLSEKIDFLLRFSFTF